MEKRSKQKKAQLRVESDSFWGQELEMGRKKEQGIVFLILITSLVALFDFFKNN